MLLYYLQLRQMNREEQIDNYQEIQDYLQQNHIHDLFSDLVQQIILEKPSNVLDFIIQKLQAPPKWTLFVVGPPGLSISQAISKTLQSTHPHLNLLNCGQTIAQSISTLPEQQQRAFKSCRLLPVESIKAAVDAVEKQAKADSNSIIEGYPKTLRQALALQERGVYAKNILVINIDDAGLSDVVSSKLKSANPDLSEADLTRLTQEATMQYRIGINEIKHFYKNYLQIDLSKKRDQQFVCQELRAFDTQTIHKVPRITSQIIIMGAPYSGRTTLGKKIANHYGFIYVSTSFLIAEQIRKDTIQGRKIKEQYMKGELIDSFLLEKLIDQRVSQKDCRMMGFVLEGYPKNQEQFENIKHMKLNPTLYVAIDTPRDISQERSDCSIDKFEARYDNWQKFKGYVKGKPTKIFWVDPTLDTVNLYEEVIHEFEKNFT